MEANRGLIGGYGGLIGGSRGYGGVMGAIEGSRGYGGVMEANRGLIGGYRGANRGLIGGYTHTFYQHFLPPHLALFTLFFTFIYIYTLFYYLYL